MSAARPARTGFAPTESRLAALGVVLALLLVSGVAHGINLGRISPSYDETRSTKYRNGDKPVDTPTCPADYTCAAKGDGAGTIDEVSETEFAFNVSGSSAAAGFKYAYRACGAGDCQIVARVTNYAGTLTNFAGIGLGISEGTADSDPFHNCWSPNSAAATGRSLAGTPPSTTSAANGSPGQARPWFLGATYDDSRTESKCFEGAVLDSMVEVATFDHDFGASPVMYLFAQSGSAVATMQGTADNIAFGTTITLYTPEEPPEVGAPTLVSMIPNQSGTQGVAFSLDISGNFTGETAYTATGIPGSSGLSFNTVSGVLSGTPNGTAVSSSPFDVLFCAVNIAGATCDTAQFTFTSATGDVLNISTGTATVDCDTFESGGKVDPGDTLVILGNASTGIRGPLVIRDCVGTASSPITIRNDTADDVPLTIRKTNSGGFIFDIVNATHVVIDGTGKWAGAPAGKCGRNPITGALGRTQCGIQIEATNGHPTSYMHLHGFIDGLTVRGIEIDGSNASGGGSGVGLQLNDHSLKDADFPTVWRQDVVIADNYVHHAGDTTGECLYIGPNGYGSDDGAGNDLPLRRIAIDNNIVENCARNGIELKYTLQGPNYIRGNLVQDVGLSGEQGQLGGISVISGGDVEISGNIVNDIPGPGITVNNGAAVNTGSGPSQTERDIGPYYATVQNNIIDTAGGGCITFARQTNSNPAGTIKDGVRIQITPALAQSNTCINSGDACVTTSGLTPAPTARDNICAGTPAPSISAAITSSNNRSGTVASQLFENAASGNYKLTVDSPACGSSTANSPATDFEGDTRPATGADQGADEELATCQ